ncbi:F-actin-capping protein subunit beta [Gamsiella multidivaricata]|uniref:F-actin-capping protein subunit beta n=1 Tax=Gamsiella multidivaricata TaxID=101098 RepID=UPI00221F8C23|nr:F-actin-capping protein subunit beta [Gamsiella multidivaricata]XP_051408988.1 F-actin-capping protein subunit beta [Gamsiella multidivaricata]KAI7816438.1 F-actin-capping protein subunit beta [Gamsiella multidivaricata]KAI7819058.1 F-actin-capping protein subunit beta [Gamsiella multidivaricata]
MDMQDEEVNPQVNLALDLMRRLPPQNAEENLASLVTLLPDLTEDLLNTVDQPLKVQTCAKTGKEYLLCEYNRDGNSYRSPWSNEFSPPLAEATYPSSKLRRLEQAANDAFDTYRELYFEGGVSSVYFWDLDPGFAGVVLIKKVGDGNRRMKGAWDSIHVFDVQEKGRNAHYQLTSTVMLYMVTNKPELGHMNLSGSMTRQAEQDSLVDDPSMHIANIGRMVEEMEIKMRHLLKDVYFGKTKDTVNDLRSSESLAKIKRQQEMQREIASKLQERQPKTQQ